MNTFSNLLFIFLTILLSGYFFIKSKSENKVLTAIPPTIPSPPISLPRVLSSDKLSESKLSKNNLPENKKIELLSYFYNFSDSQLNKDGLEDELKPFLNNLYLPAQIIYFHENGMESFFPKVFTPGRIFERTLKIGSEQFAKKIAQDRLNYSYQRSFSPQEDEDKSQENTLEPLDKQEYKLKYFNPGKKDDGLTTIALPKDINKGIYGPDFNLEDIDLRNKKQLREIRSRLVSFGHGGEMVLELMNNGFLLDKPGPDFIIYENVFRLMIEKGVLYQEFAQVAVSDTSNDQDFKWFPCNPGQGEIKGCAGVVPTSEGGDTFDLSELGIKKVKFIKIKDIGNNFNLGKESDNTEGFDLDAIGVIHGYKQK